MSPQCLALAPAPSSPNAIAEWLLLTLGVIMIVAVLAAVPIRLTIVRRHRQREAILAGTLLCGILVAATVSYSIMQRFDWTADNEQRIESGIYDPRGTSDKPTLPIATWTGLAIGYLALTAWAAMPARSD